MFRTPAGLSNIGCGGIQNLTINWEKSPQAHLSSPGPSKTPPNALPGLVPLISCIMIFSYARLAPTGCSKGPFTPKTTILIPPETQQWSESSDMAKKSPKKYSVWANIIYQMSILPWIAQMKN